METGTSGHRPPSALGSAGLPELVPRHARPTEGFAPTGRRPLVEDSDGVVLGTFVDGRDVFLADVDRRRHVYVIGKTGVGKSTFLHTLMVSDLERGRGFALLDPHGDLAERVADSTPAWRENEVIYLDPSDTTCHAGFNPLHAVEPDQRPLVAARVTAAFQHIWADSWGPRLEYILANALRLLLDAPGSTLLGLPKLLSDDNYRKRLLAHCRDPLVKSYWLNEFARYSERFLIEAVSPLQNKIGAILLSPSLRNMVGQPRSTIDVRRVMDQGQVLIVNLSKGKLGEGPSHLLGALFTTAFAQAAEARADVAENERRDFTLLVDEFQNFSNESFVSIPSEARKYRLSLVLGHQFLGQLSDVVRQGVIGNVGSIVVFRVGAEDAPLLADELGIENRLALTDTPNYSAWIKTSSAGVPSEPRLVETMLPDAATVGRLERVQRRSHARHMRPRWYVERRIEQFLGMHHGGRPTQRGNNP